MGWGSLPTRPADVPRQPGPRSQLANYPVGQAIGVGSACRQLRLSLSGLPVPTKRVFFLSVEREREKRHEAGQCMTNYPTLPTSLFFLLPELGASRTCRYVSTSVDDVDRRPVPAVFWCWFQGSYLIRACFVLATP